MAEIRYKTPYTGFIYHFPIREAQIAMNEIIEWVIRTEATAARVYEKAAALFSSDRDFARFLKHLSKDEWTHHDSLRKAAASFRDEITDVLPILPDEETQKTVESYFLLVEKKIDEGNFTRENMLDCIVSTEFSEYNDIFLYALNSLMSGSKDSISIAAKIQQHKKYIERYLRKWQEYGRYFETIRGLPDSWEVKILVVDSDRITTELLEAVLRDEGTVDKALNGEEGIQKVMEKYYDVIITEINMPGISGIEFYDNVIEKYPNVKDRFLFFTASRNEEHLSFLKEKNLRYFSKPSLIKDIKNGVIGILNR